MKKKQKPRRTAPFHVEGIGEVPMLYVETWAVYEAYRRLGFKDEDTVFLVAPNGDTGFIRKDVIHVLLRAQEREFVYSIQPIDRSFEEAKQLLTALKAAIADKVIPEPQLQEMYRSTEVGGDVERFQALATGLLMKGFHLPALEN